MKKTLEAPAWEGVRVAEAFGPSCIQNIVAERKPWTWEFMTAGEASEDCLSLNVWTGSPSLEARRPVYVYSTTEAGQVTQTDAIELAKALRRALADPQRQEKEAKVVHKLSQAIKDYFFEETGESLSDEEAREGLELHEEFLRELIVFLDGGAFSIW